jgi:hypothetical protein
MPSALLRFYGMLKTASSLLGVTAAVIHSFTGAYSPGWSFGLPFGVSWSHTYRHTVGLFWTSDQPVAETSTYTGQHNIQKQETNIHAPSGIRARDPSNQAAAHLHLRPRGTRISHCCIQSREISWMDRECLELRWGRTVDKKMVAVAWDALYDTKP